MARRNGFVGHFVFIVAKEINILLRFLALCLCLQHFDNDLLLLNQESTLDPGKSRWKHILDFINTSLVGVSCLDIVEEGRNNHLTCHAHT